MKEAKRINDFLKQRYADFIADYDPYNQEETPETLESMLYNLENIKEDMMDDIDKDEALFEVLEATIEQFKAAGIEIY